MKKILIIMCALFFTLNLAKANQSTFSEKDESKEVNELAGLTIEEATSIWNNKQSGKDKEKTENVDGVVTSPIIWLRNNIGKKDDTYTLVKCSWISGVEKKTCSDLKGHNNCTLTALYNILVYYRKMGYDKIKDDTVYDVILNEAEKLSYNYNKSKGLKVTHNDDLVKNVWRNGLGYSSGNGNNTYLWSESDAISEIDKDRPFLFSIAFGVYADHTVAVRGYYIYRNNRTKKEYTFLAISNGWSKYTTYLPWTNTGSTYLAVMTTIKAPTK